MLGDMHVQKRQLMHTLFSQRNAKLPREACSSFLSKEASIVAHVRRKRWLKATILFAVLGVLSGCVTGETDSTEVVNPKGEKFEQKCQTKMSFRGVVQSCPSASSTGDPSQDPLKDMNYAGTSRPRLWTGEEPRRGGNLNVARLNAPPQTPPDSGPMSYDGSLRQYFSSSGGTSGANSSYEPGASSVQDVANLKDMGAKNFNPEEQVSLNFQGEDLNYFLRQVLSGILGVNYIAPDNLGGTVHFKTEQPIPKSQLIRVVRDILAGNGFIMRRINGIYNIGTADSLKKLLDNSTQGKDGDLLTKTIDLPQGSPQVLAQSITSLLPQGVTVIPAYEGRALIVRASAEDMPEVENLIRVFVDNGFGNDKISIVPVTNSPPEKVAAQVLTIYNADSQGLNGRINVIPLNDQQALLVSASDRALMNGVRDLIRRLDRRLRDEPSLRVIPLQNIDAQDIADQLGKVFKDGGFGEASPQQSSSGLSSANSGSGNPQNRGSQGNASGGGLDGTGFTPALRFPQNTPSSLEEDGTGTAVGAQPSLTLRQASGTKQNMLSRDELTQSSSSSPAQSTSGRAQAQQGSNAVSFATGDQGALSAPPVVNIVPDKRNNALLVFSSYATFKRIREIVNALDIPLAQVVIEATIVEVELNDNLGYGVQWFLKGKGLAAGFSTAETGASSLDGSSLPAGGAFGISQNLGGYSAQAVLHALQSVTNVKVISSPYLTVMDGKTARLVVGDQIPIQTKTTSSSSVSGVQSTTQEITTQETGIILQVSPQIKPDNSVILNIDQQVTTPKIVSDADKLTPTIATRDIKSDIALRSGHTILLGGLIQDRLNKTESGVPLLKNLPVMGSLFRERTNNTKRVELLVMITPRVTRRSSQIENLTKSLRRYMHTGEGAYNLRH